MNESLRQHLRQPIVTRDLEGIATSLETALRMVQRFAAQPTNNTGLIVDAREQAWQAARSLSELYGGIRARTLD